MAKKEKLMKHNQCYRCVHRRTIPGDAHSRCAAVWKQGDDIPQGDPHGVRNGWWWFPYNFDPVWHMDMCSRFKEKK